MQKRNTQLLDADSDERRIDPIDALIPAPGPWWRRLIVGVLVVAAIGSGAFLWGFGYLRPQPDCCGSGSGSSLMSLSPDGDAVTTTAYFFNSSHRDLVVSAATAVLPGAKVLDVAVLDPDNDVYPTANVLPFPATVYGPDSMRFLITFRPESCVDELDGTTGWGTVTLELGVANSWVPSFGRSFEIPVVEQPSDLSVLPPASVENVPQTPLAAACALLAG